MNSLEDQVVLVAGASSGIGRACAKSFAAAGAKLIVTARREAELMSLVKELNEHGGVASGIPADLTDEAEVASVFEHLRRQHGALDVLVNSIGRFGSAPLDEFSLDLWNQVIDSNLRAPFLCIREAMRLMKEQRKGRIINIGSTSAKRVRPNSAAYSAAKHGLWGLTQVAALEGREFGVTCCCIHPGRVKVEREFENPSSEGEPTINVEEVASTICHIAALPADVAILETVILSSQQPFVGRG